ncbi:MAG: YggS family pyridoxal phosphate-dependent enzyme [Kiritimatiellae bacterium]|jgi:pyridoxal phosphate enzyme (YggS family)|nr:YggS family pyridoxal phosphate-dependent enzyme [Kiritimatiellia bacterium]MBR2940756.1 YggS family pyridoxal phosphate-dependent enzyme [Kiritimatiellia bacterium]
MKPLETILEEVESRIAAACARAGRDPADVEIVAVTKTHGAEVVQEAWNAGLRIVGENKVQEAAWKKPASVTGPMWHLIGHLQSNKVRKALGLFDFFHGVDTAALADRMNAIADDIGAAPHILLEVNVSGEKSKSGMRPEDVEPTVRHIMESCPRLTVEGLMTMAPFSENPEDARPYFRRLRELRDAVEKSLDVGLPRLSMGMSGDYEVAVEEGATWVRLGTVLFGERPKARAGIPSGGLDSYSGEGPTVRVLD